MADCYVFADEAGNFDFTANPRASRFFILTTVTFRQDCSLGDELMRLRRQLAWDGINLDRGFHASTEAQSVRDKVFDLLAPASFRIDATVLEKRKAQPHLYAEERFY